MSTPDSTAAPTAAETPWLIARSNWPTVRATPYTVAVLPWGATEAHGLHLPYATDVYEIEAIAAESAKRAWQAGAKVAVLPAIPFGVQTGQLDIPFCVNLMPSTQLAMINDILASIVSGVPSVRSVVILNGHGGNEFKPIVRELQPRFPGLFLSVASWFSAHDGKGIIDEIGDHADERETSLMLHLEPTLVAPRERWGDGSTNAWEIAGLRDKVAWAPRPWMTATNDTGVGNPRRSSAIKGGEYFDAICLRLSSYLSNLCKADQSHL